MIESSAGKRELVCDECEEETFGPYSAEDFSIMIAEAKDEGWKIYKDRETDEFVHVCPHCR